MMPIVQASSALAESLMDDPFLPGFNGRFCNRPDGAQERSEALFPLLRRRQSVPAGAFLLQIQRRVPRRGCCPGLPTSLLSSHPQSLATLLQYSVLEEWRIITESCVI